VIGRSTAGLGLLVVIGGLAASVPARPPVQKAIIFRHVDVRPMDRDVLLSDQLVLVRGETIELIRPDRPGNSGLGGTEIDGRGSVLMPGLVDFHTHSEGWEELPAYVAAGVTTIATMDGEALTGRWREGGGLPLPNLISSSEILDGNPPTNRRFYAIDAANAGAIIDEERARGADYIKIYGRLKDPARAALLAAAREKGVTVAGHIPRGADLRALFAQGLGMVAHGEEYFQYLDRVPTPAAIDASARITGQAGAAVTPDLVGYTAMSRQAVALPRELAQAGVASLSSAVYQEWLPRRNRYATRDQPANFAKRVDAGLPVLQQLARALHDRGVLLLAGTDAPIFCLPGTCLHEEVRLLAAAIGPYEALRAATVNAGIFDARLRGGRPRFGLVAPGMRADLVLLTGDPRTSLAALDAVRGVMVRGRWSPAAALDDAVAAAKMRVAPRHALVDRYEQLITARDLKPLLALIDRIAPRSEMLNANVVIFDALDLEEDGRRAAAVALLEHAAPVFRRAPGLFDVLGRMRGAQGDTAGARRAYRMALGYRKYDDVALAGLSGLAR
jgi:imidazolonepropionase-like amidohydrolase